MEEKTKSTYYLKWKVGAHTRFSKKISDTLWTSVNYGMHALQFFMGSQRSFNRANISPDDIIECKKILKRWPLHVFSHFPYTANFAGSIKQLAWDSDETQDRKTMHIIKQLQYELSVLSNFDTLRNGVVIHPGSYPDRKKGMKAIAKSINKIEFTKGSKLLLENSAGEGNKVPATLEELAYIIKHVDKKQLPYVGVCIDTCHLFAVGDYNLSKVSEIDRFFADFERLIGIERWTLLHLNDSETPRGSHVDLHACLGTGHIWSESFDSLIHLMNMCDKYGIPAVLETHGLDMITLACLQT